MSDTLEVVAEIGGVQYLKDAAEKIWVEVQGKLEPVNPAEVERLYEVGLIE